MFDHKKTAALILATKKPEDHKDDGQDDGEDYGMESCAQDVLDAIEKKSAADLAEALEDFFELCEKEPHAEGPHTNESEEEEESEE